MSAKSNWKVTVYGSAVNTTPGTTPDAYGMRTCAITALTSATSATYYIVKPEAKPEVNAEEITDVGGEAVSYVTRRGTFNIQSFPFSYAATSAADLQDIDDLVTIAGVATGQKHLYIRIEGGSRTWPSTAGTAYPVTLRSWDESLNVQQGNRTLAAVFAHKYRS
jgi:hypothetical protein